MPRRKPTPARSNTRRAFGAPRQLPSGRWQARYTGPDMQVHRAPHTFDTKDSAIAWLLTERKLIDGDDWTPPNERARAAREAEEANQARQITFGAYARKVIAERGLAPRTVDSYLYLLREHIGPTFDDVPIGDITAAQVRAWYSNVSGVRNAGKLAEGGKPRKDVPTTKARAYEVLRMILGVAVDDELIDRNPCRIRGATVVTPAHDATVLTPAEISALAEAMPPDLRLSVLLAAWCGLRRSETFELRRRDIEPDGSVVHVRRAITTRGGQSVIARPKGGSVGDVVVPEHIRQAVVAHLAQHVAKAANSLLFPSPGSNDHLAEWSYRRVWNKATETIGRPGLRLHELRHTGGTVAALAGGTLPEVMERLRHRTPAAAMRYQQIATGRAETLAANMSRLAGPH